MWDSDLSSTSVKPHHQTEVVTCQEISCNRYVVLDCVSGIVVTTTLFLVLNINGYFPFPPSPLYRPRLVLGWCSALTCGAFRNIKLSGYTRQKTHLGGERLGTRAEQHTAIPTVFMASVGATANPARFNNPLQATMNNSGARLSRIRPPEFA
ncbi:hypothetical protein F5B21DRAFT_8205 [Xylaria acuta]|nr:hypothetical protein F5B21DRAFT_8205 [Xylaria acuta]